MIFVRPGGNPSRVQAPTLEARRFASSATSFSETVSGTNSYFVGWRSSSMLKRAGF